MFHITGQLLQPWRMNCGMWSPQSASRFRRLWILLQPREKDLKTKHVEQPIAIILDPTVGPVPHIQGWFQNIAWTKVQQSECFHLYPFGATSIWILFRLQLFAASNLAPSSAAWAVWGGVPCWQSMWRAQTHNLIKGGRHLFWTPAGWLQ